MKGYWTTIIGLYLWILGTHPGFAQAATPPNIIFLLADDHRHDALGVAGNPIIQTPNLDRMARDGLHFKNAYVTTSICSVSRASILSGQYQSRHGIDDFAKNFTPEALANTYPMLLKKAGYKIGFVGKYGVGNAPPEKEFDYWKCVNRGQPPYWYTRPDGSQIHDTDTVTHSALDFIRRFADKGPFCLSVSFKAPHELDGNPPTYPVQERFASHYENAPIPLPETYGAEYWEILPDFFKSEENIGRVRWEPLFSTPELHQETVKNYYRLVTGVDEAVGKIRTLLKTLGIADNTIVIYMGDNGFSLGEHGLQGKWFGFEESIRIPLLIYDPRAHTSAGQSLREIVLNIDIAPTLLNYAGISIPNSMQGVSLIPLIYGSKPKSWRKDFYYEHTFLGSPRLPKTEGVVSLDWKFITYPEHDYDQLFHLADDPYEKQNLAQRPKFQRQLKKMKRRYAYYVQAVR